MTMQKKGTVNLIYSNRNYPNSSMKRKKGWEKKKKYRGNIMFRRI